MKSLLPLLQPGINAAKKNAVTILFIQFCCLILVVSYYQFEAVRVWADQVGVLKKNGGLVAAFVSCFIAGGFFPEIAKFCVRKSPKYDRAQITSVLWTAVVYGYIGVTVDIFYNLQATLFGSGVDVVTLAKKMAFDILVFAPLFSIPTSVMLFTFGYDGFKREFWTKKAFTKKYLMNAVLPAMPMGWAFWIPVLLCLYSLPTSLQFPFAMLAEAAWSILFVFLLTPEDDPDLNEFPAMV